MKKYELTTNTISVYGTDLYQIKALRDFSDVKKGDLGGYVRCEDNLSHDGNCWVYDQASVMDNGSLEDNATMTDNARMEHNAKMLNNSSMKGFSKMLNNAKLIDNAKMSENSMMVGYTLIGWDTKLSGCMCITDEPIDDEDWNT